jgi:hypothetical protein
MTVSWGIGAWEARQAGMYAGSIRLTVFIGAKKLVLLLENKTRSYKSV